MSYFLNDKKMEVAAYITFTLDEIKEILISHVEGQGYKCIGPVDFPPIVPKGTRACVDIEIKPEEKVGKGGMIMS